MDTNNDTQKTEYFKRGMTDKTELHEKWGKAGSLILEAGAGGGYVTLPYVLDDYESALGLEPLETWLIKRLLRHYWKAGDEVYPSFDEITRQAKISAPTLRKLRKQLTEKGLIKVTGRKGKTNGSPDNRVTISLKPLFIALLVCILCDPQSKINKKESHKEIREQFSLALGNDPGRYSFGERFKDLELPVSVEEAKAYAEADGFTLDWQVISQMQGQAAMAEVQEDKERYERQLELKLAIEEGSSGRFSINWGWNNTHKLLLWLVGSQILPSELAAIVRDYADNIASPYQYDTDARYKRHTFKAFDRHVRSSVKAWNSQDNADLKIPFQVGMKIPFRTE